MSRLHHLRMLVWCAALPLLGAACTTGDGDPACDGCMIGGTCFPAGVANPDDPCLGCDPASSVTAWRDLDGALCDDGLFCNGADTCLRGSCTAHGGNPCGGGLVCVEADRQCVGACGGCVVEGVCFLNGERSPVNPCQVCDAGTSTTAFTDDDGASCDDGAYCNGADTCAGGSCATHDGNPCGGGLACAETARQCVSTCGGCLVAGVCLLDGEHSPINPCQVCDAGASTTAFTDDDGASCDDGLFCNGADTCAAGACVHGGSPCAADDACWETLGGRCCSQATVRGCDATGRVVERDSCDQVVATIMSCSAHGSVCQDGRCLCDPVAGTGCPAGDKCSSTGVRTECVPDGTRALGETCTVPTTGADDCAAGLICADGFCAELCGRQPETCPTDFSCWPSTVAAAFLDQSDVGVCYPLCDPVAQDCADVAQACYLNVADGRSRCMAVPSLSVGVLQDDPCYSGGGACFMNGCDEGHGALLPGNACAFFCTPIDNWLGHVQGVSGDPAGTTCAAQFQGARPDGPGSSYECRFIQSYYANASEVAPTIGMCVDPSSAAGGGSCAAFDWVQFQADVSAGTIIDAAYCAAHPTRCMFDCISQATFLSGL